MVAKILDGKAASVAWEAELAAKLGNMQAKPCIALVRVGEDPASVTYVKKKIEMCTRLGIVSQFVHLPQNTTQDELMARLEKLNTDPRIHAILVQVPLPDQIDAVAVQNAIAPLKDVDGFGPENMGLLLMGRPRLVAATPAGVMRLLKHYSLDVTGKNCVVVGRSNIVGKPLAQLLLNADATVTMAHSKTQNLAAVTKQADFLFSAVGKPGLITGAMVKKGAIVVDIGTSKNDEGKLAGDAQFESVKKRAAWLSPVPGGVGPMTIMSLMANTISAYELQNKRA